VSAWSGLVPVPFPAAARIQLEILPRADPLDLHAAPGDREDPREVDEELARLRERLAAGADQGHRTVPHTADLRIEAWAPTREACLAEAVRGLVDSFAVVAAARPRHTAERRFLAGSDEDLLVAIIDEVIYRLDADGEIPAAVTVRPTPDGGVILVLPLAKVSEAEITGAAPKAASLHDLRCAPDAAGRWSCGITIDV